MYPLARSKTPTRAKKLKENILMNFCTWVTKFKIRNFSKRIFLPVSYHPEPKKDPWPLGARYPSSSNVRKPTRTKTKFEADLIKIISPRGIRSRGLQMDPWPSGARYPISRNEKYLHQDEKISK